MRMCLQHNRREFHEDGIVQAWLNRYSSAMSELLMERPATSACLDDPTADGLDRIGFALADPIRREILVRLCSGSACPSDLADAIGTSRSNLSNHLACLRGCALVSAERSGRHLHYRLVSERFASALQSLLEVAALLPPCDGEFGAQRDDAQ